MTQMFLIYVLMFTMIYTLHAAHPINLLIMMVFYTMVSFCLVMKIISFWLMSLLILLFLSGISIMLMYMTTFTHLEVYHEKRKHNIFYNTPVYMMFLFLGSNMFKESLQHHLVSQLFSTMWVSIYFLIIVYLFMMMAGVMKMLEIYKGSLTMGFFYPDHNLTKLFILPQE